jgi:hypothetical protein
MSDISSVLLFASAGRLYCVLRQFDHLLVRLAKSTAQTGPAHESARQLFQSALVDSSKKPGSANYQTFEPLRER